MTIAIPEEYRAYFEGNIAYITRWRKSSLLLMNKAEHEAFQMTTMAGAWIYLKSGQCSFLKTSVIELIITEGAIELPEGFVAFLQGENRGFKQEEAGIILS